MERANFGQSAKSGTQRKVRIEKCWLYLLPFSCMNVFNKRRTFLTQDLETIPMVSDKIGLSLLFCFLVPGTPTPHPKYFLFCNRDRHAINIFSSFVVSVAMETVQGELLCTQCLYSSLHEEWLTKRQYVECT